MPPCSEASPNLRGHSYGCRCEEAERGRGRGESLAGGVRVLTAAARGAQAPEPDGAGQRGEGAKYAAARQYSQRRVAGSCASPSRRAVQADEVKARLFTMANKGTKGLDTPFSDAGKAVKKGSITDDDMKRLIDQGTDQARQHGLQPPIHRGAVSRAWGCSV